MTQRERQGWIVVISLAVVAALVSGPATTSLPVFFRPLTRQFHLTRAEVSSVATALALSNGLISPIAGWLLDRIPARGMMAVGLLISTLGYLIASQANSLQVVCIAFVIVGIGISTGVFLPAMLIAVSWFKDRRGLVLGVAVAGGSAGMTIAPLVLGQVLIRHSWRVGMVGLAAAVFCAIPIVLLTVRAAPMEAGASERKREADALPGLDMDAARKSPAFWMLIFLQLFSATAIGAVLFHIVPFLIGAGFAPPLAATLFGLQAGLAWIGWVGLGWVADRLGARATMVLAAFTSITSIVCLMDARPTSGGMLLVAVFAFCWATTAGVSSTVIPVMATEMMGVRRFGTITGILHLVFSIGQATGPLIAGRIFDVTGSYTYAFELAILLQVIVAFASILIRPAVGHDLVPVAASAA